LQDPQKCCYPPTGLHSTIAQHTKIVTVYYMLQLDSYPTVLVAVFIEQPTPFLEEFLDKIYHTEYPKQKLHLFVHNSVRMPVYIIYTKYKSVFCLVLHI